MRVIKVNDGFEGEDYYIVENDQIEQCNLCECTDRYGNKIGCENAGCFPLNEHGEETEETEHISAVAVNYHDGHNWRSFIVETELDDPNICDGELLEDNNPVAQEILADYENAKWGEWSQGSLYGETEKYAFIMSKWQGEFAIATVGVK